VDTKYPELQNLQPLVPTQYAERHGSNSLVMRCLKLPEINYFLIKFSQYYIIKNGELKENIRGEVIEKKTLNNISLFE